MTDIIDFDNYRIFLENHFREKGVRKGHKAKAAQAMGVQASYLSRVLKDQAQLSLEQAFDLADHLELLDIEKSYFLLLVQKDRAGTHQLRKHYENELEKIQEAQKSLKNVLEDKGKLTEAEKSRYYSHWVYAAIHIMVSVPQFSSRTQLIKAIDCEPNRVNEAIQFLLECGLVVDEKGVLKMGPAHIHLPHDSPYIVGHHSNWRLQAIQNIEKGNSSGFHYTGVWSLSKETAEEINKYLRKAVKENIAEVKDSPAEEVYCYQMDFFKLV